MSSSRIIYAPRPDTTPETEISALGNVYRFILDCHAKKEDTRPGAPNDGTKSKENSANERIIQQSA